MTSNPLRLGINIDHVATLRNARGGVHPCPVAAAQLAARAGADGITAHLREDRRHVRDADMRRLKAEIALPLNFEMAATAEMLALALEIKPNACCLVPERREERTTEGGLDVVGQEAYLRDFCGKLRAAGIRVSLFVAPDTAQIEASQRVGAYIVELHTGKYAQARSAKSPPPEGEGRGGGRASGKLSPQLSPPPNLPPPGGGAFASRCIPSEQAESWEHELDRLCEAAKLAHSLGLEVHAGHGLNFENVSAITAIPEIVELNIGHFIIGEAVFLGLESVIKKMQQLMQNARVT